MSTHIELIDALGNLGFTSGGAVVEIGSQRFTGQGSSFKLLEYARRYHLNFFTIDADPEVSRRAQQSVGDAASTAKGEEFLISFGEPILALYLDNYDVIYSPAHSDDLKRRIGAYYESTLDYSFGDAVRQNVNSSLVHLRQLEAAFQKLCPRCLVAVDDTKLVRSGDTTYWWGKGNTVVPLLLQAGFSIVKNGSKGLVLGRGL